MEISISIHNLFRLIFSSEFVTFWSVTKGGGVQCDMGQGSKISIVLMAYFLEGLNVNKLIITLLDKKNFTKLWQLFSLWNFSEFKHWNQSDLRSALSSPILNTFSSLIISYHITIIQHQNFRKPQPLKLDDVLHSGSCKWSQVYCNLK